MTSGQVREEESLLTWPEGPNWPAGHGVPVQPPRPPEVVHVPATHGTHVAADEAPSTADEVPAAQDVHAAALVWPGSADQLPIGQFVQAAVQAELPL